MEIVNEMYSEKDSLETTIEWNIKKIIHKRGRDWCPVMFGDILGGELQDIARESSLDVDAFVFLTASYADDGLGLAYVGTTCSPDKGMRISMNRYTADGESQFKGKDAYTAEVKFTHGWGFSRY